MKSKSIGKNYIYNLIYQILLIIVPFITFPYISRVLGADKIGQNSFASSVVSYFSLFATFGITNYGRREISYVQDDRSKRSQVFWETKLLQLITSSIACFCYMCFVGFQEDRLFYFIYIFFILTVAADVTWFFQGMEDFKKIVIRNSFFKILNVVYIFMFVKEREDLIVYVLGLAVFPFLGNCSLWYCLSEYVDKPNWHALKPLRNIMTVLSLFIPTIAIEIYTVLDKTMIGLITKSSFENGYYEQAIKMSKVTLSIITALGPVMIPRIGFYFQKGNMEKVQFYLYRGYRFVWFMGIPMCLGMIGISYHTIPWFLGDGYEKVSLLLNILSLLILAIGLNTLTGNQYLIPTKRQNTYTTTVLIGAAVNFTTNLILIPGNCLCCG